VAGDVKNGTGGLRSKMAYFVMVRVTDLAQKTSQMGFVTFLANFERKKT